MWSPLFDTHTQFINNKIYFCASGLHKYLLLRTVQNDASATYTHTLHRTISYNNNNHRSDLIASLCAINGKILNCETPHWFILWVFMLISSRSRSIIFTIIFFFHFMYIIDMQCSVCVVLMDKWTINYKSC